MGYFNSKPKSKPPIVVMSDDVCKRILSTTPIMLNDSFVRVQGRVIGWKRTNLGTLGAVVLNELSGQRFLFCVDIATGRPRKLATLG